MKSARFYVLPWAPSLPCSVSMSMTFKFDALLSIYSLLWNLTVHRFSWSCQDMDQKRYRPEVTWRHMRHVNHVASHVLRDVTSGCAWVMVWVCRMFSGKEPEPRTLEEMLQEAPGSLNFTMFLYLFGDKMKGRSKWNESISKYNVESLQWFWPHSFHKSHEVTLLQRRHGGVCQDCLTYMIASLLQLNSIRTISSGQWIGDWIQKGIPIPLSSIPAQTVSHIKGNKMCIYNPWNLCYPYTLSIPLNYNSSVWLK